MLFNSKNATFSLFFMAFALLAGPARSSDVPERWLVTLEGECLAEAIGTGRLVVPLRGGKPDLDSPRAMERRSRIAAAQEELLDALAAVAPEARAIHRFAILHNGVVVTGADRVVLERLPGVAAVRPMDTHYVTPVLDSTIDLIDAGAMWEALGGQEAAGAGVKVAVIDSGIDIDNPFFSPYGFEMPAGFPKGETAFTTAKVIAARAYFRDYDPPDPEKDTEDPIDHGGHGSHCAGIIAGVAGNVFDLSGTPTPVSGVAPAAYLMNYKVFYNASSGQEGAFDAELMAAFEDAVADGADVISCSWGGADTMLGESVPGQVYQAAMDAGVVVVFAAGNEGWGPGTVGHPGTLPRVLTVGSVSSGRYFAGYLDVLGPGDVPSELQGISAIKGAISPSFSGDSLGPLPLVSARVAGAGENNDGCDPYPFGVFEGAAALVERGNCYFSQKIDNAYLAGAEGVVVFNNVDGEAPISMGGEDVQIPAVQIGNEDGVALEKWVIENDPGAVVEVWDTLSPYTQEQSVETVAGSSSRGPTDAPLLKPEIAAPGVRVLSADAHWPGSDGQPWGLKSGTSMACPHVSGAAALVRQLHPGLSPEAVQAMLVGAVRVDFATADKTSTTDVGAGILDLGNAREAGAYAIPAAISFGESAGTWFSATLSIHDTYWYAPLPVARWQHEHDQAVEEVPASATLVGLGDGELVVSLRLSEDAPAGSYTGRLILEGVDSDVVIPYHARLLPEPLEDLLILDMSFLQAEQKLLVNFYSGLAEEAGIPYEILRLEEEEPAPTLAELLAHPTILAFTGNDQVYYDDGVGWRTMDALSTYARKGGNLIVAGQGPFRGSDHKRFHGFVGAATADDFPFFDAYTQEVVDLPSFLVSPPEEGQGRRLIELPVDIGPETDGIGDLEFVGDLNPYPGAGLPAALTEPFLVMDSPIFDGDRGVLGMVLDPYRYYGIYPEVEVLEGRAAIVSFGFERIGSPADETSGAQELFEALYEWVTDRIDVSVEIEAEELGVALYLSCEPGTEQYEVDFGDGTGTIETPFDEVYHEYDDYGVKGITVTARSALGAVDVERFEVVLEPAQPDDGGVTDTDDGDPVADDGPIYEERIRDCGCANVGAGDGGEGALLLLVLLGVLLLSDALARQ